MQMLSKIAFYAIQKHCAYYEICCFFATLVYFLETTVINYFGFVRFLQQMINVASKTS